VRRELPGGYELDDDRARLDLDAIWDFLSTEAYWGRDRSRDVVERQVRDAALRGQDEGLPDRLDRRRDHELVARFRDLSGA